MHKSVSMPNLTKRDLVLRISHETGLTQKDVSTIIDSTIKHLSRSLVSGQAVEFRNFGIFHIRVHKPRIGRNPKRPEHNIRIPSRAVVRFKAGKTLKSKVMALGPKLESRPPAGIAPMQLK